MASNFNFYCRRIYYSSFLTFSQASFFLCSSFFIYQSCFLVSLGAAFGGIFKQVVQLQQKSSQINKQNMNEQEYLSRIEQLKQTIKDSQEVAKTSLVTLNITQVLQVKGALDMVFYFMPQLAKKVQKIEQNHKNIIKFNPFLKPEYPYRVIYKELLIQELGERHRLLFNKFNIYRNHLLVITRQFQSQLTKISQEDMASATLVVLALDGILFFNGGIESGASQQHKHLQILPQEARKLPIFNKMYNFVNQYDQKSSKEIIRFPEFNFLHGIIKISLSQNKKNTLSQHLTEAYNILYHELIQKSEGKYKYYNLVACQGFILIAIRKKQHAFGHISVNSLGFMGSLLFRDPLVMQTFKSEHSPSQILEDICQK